VQSYLSKVISLTGLVGFMAVASLPAVAGPSKKVGAESKPAATSTKPASTVKPTAVPAKPAAEKPTVSETTTSPSETTTSPVKPTLVKPTTVKPAVEKPSVSETTASPAEKPASEPADSPTSPSSSEKPSSSESPTAPVKPSSSESPTAPVKPSSSERPSSQPSASESSTTVAGMVGSSNSFKTLAAAIKAADLDATLSGKGPYTLFAPTDQAFAALPKGTVETLLKPENKDKLVKVLTYHVISSEAATSDLKAGKVTSVEGSPIDVKLSGQDVIVNDSKVLKADVKASNGIIHVIDKVMLPPDLKQ
jgi:uncharacterized surface protein with fasciclin (FAS1) repeats